MNKPKTKSSGGFLRRWMLALLLAPGAGLAQRELEVTRGWIEYSDLPNSLYKHLATQAYTLLDRREAELAQINTLSEWKQRQARLKKALAAAVGPFPAKTPLNARVLRRLDKDGYHMEHLVYESQPGYFVTATLFVPAAGNGKRPAVIYCSGHSATGYRSYQSFLVNLVKKGFVVLAFDPSGQGERLLYADTSTGKSKFRWPAWEHSYAGAQLFMTGNNLARHFIWDGIRAVDYLLTRSEVDPARLAISGRSGGGTQSAYIAAFDERIRAVAPENYITSFRRLYQSIGPQDAEQVFPSGLVHGLDMADLLAVRAPKPALVVATTQDMFPIQGALETTQELRRIYEAYGQPSQLSLAVDDAPHASTKKNREAVYAFLRRSLNWPCDTTDQVYTPLSAEELKVTATGLVQTALRSESPFSLTYNLARGRLQQLHAARKDPAQHLPTVLKKAKTLSGYREPAKAESPLFMGRLQRDGYAIEKYLLKGEGSYYLPYVLLVPKQHSGHAVVYLHPQGKYGDTSRGGYVPWLLEQGHTVVLPDLVGSGETGPGAFKGDSYIDSVSYNTWFAALHLGRSITGIQAADLVKLARTLTAFHSIKNISGFAHGPTAPALLHAAAFAPQWKNIVLHAPYYSFAALALQPWYKSVYLHSVVPGAVGQYDLADLAASLVDTKLMLLSPRDAMGLPAPPDAVKAEWGFVQPWLTKNGGAWVEAMDTDRQTIESTLKRWLP